MFPETSKAVAEALLNSPEFAPFPFQDRVLTARLVERGVQPVAGPDGKWTEEVGYEVVFEGGLWGPHTLRCSTSSPERIRAHWDGYKVAHLQHAERQVEQAKVPAGTKYKPEGWRPKVGDRVWFPRGMFGRWEGRIVRFTISRAKWHGGGGGVRLAEVRFSGRNGNRYSRLVEVCDLTHNGRKPVED